MNLFRHSDFREILKLLVGSKQKSEPGFNFSSLATVLGVQKTYLSKVMNQKATLSSDQLFLLTEFFGLTREENEFLILLLEYDRTGLARRKKILLQRIAAVQSAQRKPDQVMTAEFMSPADDGAKNRYYLDPYMTIVHMFLMLPQFGGSPKAIAKRLGLDSRYTRKITETLEEIGIIEKVGNQNRDQAQYRVVKDYLQLAPNSPLMPAYNSLFRLASAQQVMKVNTDLRCAYSMTFAADEKTRARIHELFLELLRKIEEPIRKAPSEEVFQMNFDLFAW